MISAKVEIKGTKCIVINYDLFLKVMKSLVRAEYRVWMFAISKNINGNTVEFRKREAADNLGISKTAVSNAINGLIEKGLMEKVENCRRTYRLIMPDIDDEEFLKIDI